MQQVDQLIHARWVIPVEPAGEVLPAHTLLVRDGRIAAVLPTAIATRDYTAPRIVHLPRHALIPGFVNAHTHAAMSLFRGLADDLPLKTWLEDHVWPAEARWADREFVRDGTRLAVAEMLLGGTTCFNDMYFFPDEAAAAAIEAGIRAVVGMILIGFPSAWARDTREYFANGQAVHDRYRGHPLIRTAFAPHAPYTVDDDALRRVAVRAEELDVPVHMHVHETAREVEDAVQASGERPLARLERLGLLSHRLLAVHMTALSPAEIRLLATAGVSVAHCPESNLKLASGFCPLGALAAAGVNCALGTDGAASNNDLDMLGEMRTAALLAKAVAGDPCAVPAHSALAMATLNGARALGLDHETGSLAAGKSADCIAVDLGGLRAQPLYDPISQIVYASHRDQISDVWVAGRRVVEDRRLTSLDEQDLLATAERWRARIGPA
ncbi:MAG TPA: TRZ/ATZ family hydrolase [Gammaproteobacteria bacterium]|nr:TRZ/ATZ family hydrolase [Gammaproteobacteria bacterium]